MLGGMSVDIGKMLRLSEPRGPVLHKYRSIVHNHNFAEEGIAGPLATSKSTAGMDFLVNWAISYPGSNLLMARATLQSLKNSTLLSWQRRYGMLFDGTSGGGSQNLNEGRFSFPPQVHPVTGQVVQSTLKAIGVDRTDLDQLVRSTEFSAVFFEEANEIEMDDWNSIMTRTRQQVFHATKRVWDMCVQLSYVWRIHPEDVYEILLADPLHPVGQNQLALDDPMPNVHGVLKAAWNPRGDEAIWKRFCAVPYPQPYPDPEWVRENVGIREVQWSPEDRLEGSEVSGEALLAGQVAMMPWDNEDGFVRRFVAREDLREGVVYFVPNPDEPNWPDSAPSRSVGAIGQRNFLYIMPSENLSRNFGHSSAMLLVDRQKRREAVAGIVDKRAGLVFTNFVDDYGDGGGQVVRWGPDDRLKLARKGLPVFVGLDQGGSHATAAIFAVYHPVNDVILVYDEHVVVGEHAQATAHAMSSMFLPGAARHTVAFDPAMNARAFQRDTEYRIIHEYQEVLSSAVFVEGDRGPDAFDLVNTRLAPSSELFAGYAGPRLLVAEHCEMTRQALLGLSWKMVRFQRDNTLVDVGDALKILVSGVRKTTLASAPTQSPEDIFRPRLAWSGD